MLRTRLLVVAVAAAIVAAGPCGGGPEGVRPDGVPPPVSQNEPGPGDPPIVWLAGTLEAIEENHLAIREGNGPRIRLERLAAGATSFFRFEEGAWMELSEDEADFLSIGERACAETLLDGGKFLALRVFLGSSCGPTGGPA